MTFGIGYTPPTVLSVTAFGDYLRCPYRFYLRHIAGTRPLEDRQIEMAANQFGNLIHDTLEAFGKDGPKHSTNLQQVTEAILDTATDLARRRFGEQPSAPVRLQINSAISRLEFVAKQHVERAKAGWLLQAAEMAVEVDDNAFLVVDGERFGLKGRIDRVDYNEQQDMYAVIDYKTHKHRPEKKHFSHKTQRWIDLQLPLYRHMLRAIGVHAEDEYVQLGYFNIGEREQDVRVNIANFSQQQYELADQQAAEVVRGVRTGQFEPNPDAATNFDDYAVLCQTGVIAQPRGAEDEISYDLEEIEL